MSVLEVHDPAMRCATGAGGPVTGRELPFSADATLTGARA